jgi:rhamnogalacturonan endolyase
MRVSTSIAAIAALSHGANAAFGLTSTTNGFKVDTDGGLVFEINKYI